MSDYNPSDILKVPSPATGDRPVKPLDNATVVPGVNQASPITLGDLKARLRNLEVNLEAEGAYTRGNTVWLALEAIKFLQGLK